jgi:hypothetical protein
MVISNLYIWWFSIPFPICNSISHYNAFKIYFEIVLILDIVLVYLVCEIGNIDSSIWLTWNVKFMRLKFREFVIKWENGLEIVKRGYFIIKHTIFIRAKRKAYSTWTFNVKHVSLRIPWVIILMECSSSIFHYIRSMFLHESYHWRTSRSSIQPYHKWVVLWIWLTLSKHVVETLRCWRNLKVSRIHWEIKGCLFRKWFNLIWVRSCKYWRDEKDYREFMDISHLFKFILSQYPLLLSFKI